jgi:ketosteroid isomerase-like protein
MSNPNVALVYDTLAAYQQGDEERLRSLIHPEAEAYGAPGLINTGTYRGYEGLREWLRQWEEAWDEESYELGEIIEVDDSILVVPVRVGGRGAGSGVEIDRVFAWLYQWEDGLARRFHIYPDVEAALAAASELAAGQS